MSGRLRTLLASENIYVDISFSTKGVVEKSVIQNQQFH